MRFFADGPSIPDELLWERDEGKVVFFCGAGVSRAYAGLPDFFGLANVVAKHLGIGKDSDAYRLIHSAHEIEKNAGISGLISADRIFGLLERDFRAGDIEEAVASALNPEKQDSPKKPEYLKAHQILLDLATGEDGKVRLVTTNFDRLFEQCRKKLKIWQSPKLPDPSRVDEMDGIVYLHGLATKDYKGAEGDGFILSTSQFGKAYLAEGWATQFIRQILDNYTIVFVGYSADDPPVQYLLEALHKMKATHNKIYAFQSDDGEDVINRWKFKGVMPICFPAGDYKILWKTLEAWAKRARNPDKWYEQVIKKYASNPRALQPFERGQIAHIVSSSEGAKKFAEAKTVPSAEWLYVFDEFWRYATPYRSHPSFSDEDYVDPFSLYGLDSDVLPSRIDPIDDNREREVPSNAWDAFDINQRDQASVDEMNIATLKDIALRPIGRLAQLAIWLTKVLDQPPALCWAARQSSLNRFVISIISNKLLNYSQPIHPLIRRRWKILIDVWKNRSYFTSDQLFFLKKDRNWNATVVEQFEKLTQPYLSVRPFRYRQTIPQKLKINRENINQFAPVTITYPHFDQPLDIPDEWCYTALKTLRRNLEFAILCEKEIGKYKRLSFQPIIYDKDHNGIEGIHHPYGVAIYTSDLSYMVIYFARLFDQLCKIDPSAAKFEFLSWPQDDEMAFAHLRIWAAGKNEIVANDEFGQFILSLPDEIFWNPQHQLDLLMVLKKRWDNLNSSTRAMIEKRLLKNSSCLSREDQCTRKKRHAYLSLNNLWWLKSNGCELSSATQKKAQKLRSVAPEWTEKYALNTPRRVTSAFIKSNTDYTALINIPLSKLLTTAEKIQQSRDDFNIVNRPFEGLVENKPVRAFSALCLEVKKGIFREWAWQTFFYSKPHKADQNRFKLLIANRLLHCPDEQIAKIFIPVVYWLSNNAEKLENTYIPAFFHLAKKLVEILRIQPDNDQSNIEQSIDKLSDAANAPAGMMTLALLSAAFVQNLNDKSFHKEWSKQMESLLKLPDSSRQYVLVILFTHINWFFKTDKNWTQKYLLPVFHSNESIDRDAAWAGFLRARVLPCLDIFKNIKDDLFKIVKNRPSFYLKNIDNFAELILELWTETDNATGAKRVTDEELHELLLKSDDKFRIVILDHLKLKILNKNVFPNQWKSRLPELFAIWPKQIKAWSPEVSAGFFNLLIWSDEQFPVLLNLVINRLNKVYDIRSANLYSLTVSGFGNRIIQDYPKELLELLFTVLPDNASQWPYSIAEILQKIVETDSSLKKDERYVELKRRYSI
ncbi:SIR2 family protein [Bartonella apihabitans]|uniref:SIR2 family protein n=1 Tax=uncultured Bartonella sp. TaxID=104108 RepID=UPI0025FA8677|nr:SIR2 family protein [Bartonella apihabitans]WLT08169.1 SIR2 family protein [Bartonella apihabitans]